MDCAEHVQAFLLNKKILNAVCIDGLEVWAN